MIIFGRISSILIGRAPTTLRSHLSRAAEYFHALKGPIIGANENVEYISLYKGVREL